MSNIIIRKGNMSDIPSIYRLVVELAIYEKEPDAVQISSEYYITNFNNGVFDFIVAECNDEIIGMALYYLSFSTWKGRMLYLEDFLVTAQHRKLGIGQLLWDQLLIEAKSLECNLVKWQVLDWNEPAIAFYKKNQATIEKEWWNGKIVF